MNGERMRAKEGAILALGQPLLDVVAHVPFEFMKKYDLQWNNFTLAGNAQEGVYEEVVDAFQVNYVAGGCALNTLRVAQWMMQESPRATTFVGTVGNDRFGEILTESCKNDGVRGDFQIADDLPTGVCAVLVNDDGERSLCTRLDASKASLTAYLQSGKLLEAIDMCQVIYFTAFMLNIEDGAKTLLHVSQLATERNKVVMMNLSAPFLITSLKDSIDALLPFVDIVICNEVEAETFAKQQGWSISLEDVALRLSAKPKASGTRGRIVIFTQGPDSVIVSSGGQVVTFPVPPLHHVEDTNGAGDSFVGGFLSKFVMDASMHECIRAGVYAARVVIQRSGCTFPPQPDWF